MSVQKQSEQLADQILMAIEDLLLREKSAIAINAMFLASISTMAVLSDSWTEPQKEKFRTSYEALAVYQETIDAATRMMADVIAKQTVLTEVDSRPVDRRAFKK